MLITVCDVPEERRSDVERAGGEVVRIWNCLMDVQFKEHMINASNFGNVVIRPNNGGAKINIIADEYSRIYIQ